MPGRGRAVALAALALAVLALAAEGAVALAHDGRPPEPHDLWAAWNWDPTVLLGLVVTGWAYGRGVRALWRRAGPGRGVRVWQVAAFAGGLLALVVALVSPLDALGHALFSAHMVQHLVLMMAAAPLLVVGAPTQVLLWAVPASARRSLAAWSRRATVVGRTWRAVSRPGVAWGLHAAALWVWHVPLLYEAALRSELVHLAEHASFVGTAILFWRVVAECGAHGRMDRGVGVLYVFTMAMQGGILGALMTFAPTPWYPVYAASVAPWGLTPLEDQQLAGLIMWVPSGLLYLVAALLLLGAWLRAAEATAARREARFRSGP